MQAWEEFLKNQEKLLGIETVQKWLRPLKTVHFDACNLYLEAEDSFHVVWFEEHMRPKVLQGFHNNNNHQIKVHLSVNDSAAFQDDDAKKNKTEPASLSLNPDQ